MRRGKCRLARAPALRPLNRRRGKYTVDLSFFSLLSTLRSSRPPRPQSRRALPHPVAHAPRVHPATSRRLGRPGRGWPRQAKEALGRHAAQSGRPAVAATHPRHRRSRVVPSAPAAGRPCGSWGRGGIGGAIGGARGGVCAADTALICSGSCVLRTSGAGHQGARGDTPLARLEHGVAAAAALGGIAAHRGSAGCAVWLPWRHPAGRWRGGRARAARRCCGSLAAWQGTLCLWTHGERSRSIKPPSIMRPRSPIPLSTLVSSSEMSYTASTASDETRYGRRRIGDEIGSTIDVVNALQRASEPHQRDRGPHFPPCPPPPPPPQTHAPRGGDDPGWRSSAQWGARLWPRPLCCASWRGALLHWWARYCTCYPPRPGSAPCSGEAREAGAAPAVKDQASRTRRAVSPPTDDGGRRVRRRGAARRGDSRARIRCGLFLPPPPPPRAGVRQRAAAG